MKYLSDRMNQYCKNPSEIIPPRKTWDVLKYETIELLPFLDKYEDWVESTGGRLKAGIEITDNQAFQIIKKLDLKMFKGKNGRWYLFLNNLK